MRKQLIVVALASVLSACDSPRSEVEAETQKTATQELLEGKAVKSPVLDFSKYDGPPSKAPKTTATPPPKEAKSEKDSSGFKKSPVLDFSKY